MGGDASVNRFIMLLRMVPRRKVQRTAAVGVALITADLARRPTIITSRKAAPAPSPVAAEEKQFTLVRPWCSNAGPGIRLPIIRPPVIKRRRETILRPAIRHREITQRRATRLRVALRVSMAAVAAARRPLTVVVEAAVIAAAAEAALLDPMAVVVAATTVEAVAVTAAAAEATVKV
jgi:hypothetical protein